MIIALLVVLGVDLIAIVAVVAGVISRRRWLKRQPGEFAGAIRVASGHVDGLGPKWKRGSGRWVSDVLVWTKAPLMLQNELVRLGRLSNEHVAEPGEVKHLGDNPVVLEFAADGATVEVAAKRGVRALVAGPLSPTP
jgi:Protein of unknown function (DUF2550)